MTPRGPGRPRGAGKTVKKEINSREAAQLRVVVCEFAVVRVCNLNFHANFCHESFFDSFDEHVAVKVNRSITVRTLVVVTSTREGFAVVCVLLAHAFVHAQGGAIFFFELGFDGLDFGVA